MVATLSSCGIAQSVRTRAVMSLDIAIYRSLSDNCGALLRDPASGKVALVDCPDAGEALSAAQAWGWTITDVFITHEHADHIQGIPAVVAATGASVTGPAQASAAGLTRIVTEGDRVSLGETSFDIWSTPGHAVGHLVWVSGAAKLALVGDVVFVMGCGRLFGDTAPLLWRALTRIMALPDDTQLITGHDYTWSNARFARSVDPANAALAARAASAQQHASAHEFWALTTVGEEKATNPFFRAGEPALLAATGETSAAANFARLRQMKNEYRG